MATILIINGTITVFWSTMCFSLWEKRFWRLPNILNSILNSKNHNKTFFLLFIIFIFWMAIILHHVNAFQVCHTFLNDNHFFVWAETYNINICPPCGTKLGAFLKSVQRAPFSYGSLHLYCFFLVSFSNNNKRSSLHCLILGKPKLDLWV